MPDISAEKNGNPRHPASTASKTTTGGDDAVTILSFAFADPERERAHLRELFRFRDGQICEIRPDQFDPAAMVAARAAKLAR